jgi:hypothetical protein
MALAPVAVLIVLFGQSAGALRVAVTLAVFTIVMLAISMAMRPSVDMLRVDIEHRVLDEVERVRVRAREETTIAARNTHRALSDKIHTLAESVEDLRAQLDEVQSSGALAPPSAPDPVPGGTPGGPGVFRTETVHVTRRTTMVDASDGPVTGTVYGSRAAGVPMEGEWREERQDARRDEGSHRRDDRGGDQRWDGIAAGDRWAAVRDDEHGREFSLGERRTSRHSDDRGSELRVEDRWAALRRDEPRERREHGPAEPSWEAMFPSMSRPAQHALPPSRGESPGRYIDDWDDDRDRVPAWSRGNDRESDRSRDDWERHFDRGYERPPDRDRDRDLGYERDRGYEPDRDRGHERDRGYERDRDRDRGYDRDRGGYDRDRDRDPDRGYDRDRGYDDRGSDRDRSYPPRQRPGHPSEYDR